MSLRARARHGDGSEWWLLWSVLLGLFGFGATITILGASLSDIARDLGTTTSALSWTVTGPMLAMAVGTALFGKLGDIHGHRRVYLWGMAVAALATLLSALAWNAPSLIASRLLAGLGGAAAVPTSLALILEAFPVERRAQAMGWFQFVVTGAPVIGLVAGGPLVEQFGWRVIFAVFAPFAALGCVAVAAFVAPDRHRDKVPLDWLGAVTLAAAVVGALLGLDRGTRAGFTQPVTLLLFAAAVLGAAGFVAAERRTTFPLLRLDYFHRRMFSATIGAQTLCNFCYMGGFIVTPLLLRERLGFSLAATTWILVLRPLTFSLSSPVGGTLGGRIGERRAMLVAAVLMTSSMVTLTLASLAETVALVAVGLVLSGLAFGLGAPSFATAVADAADDGDLGVANGMAATMGQIGAVAGIQLMLVTVGDASSSAAFVSAYGLGIVGGAVAIACALATRRSGRRRATVPAPAPIAA